SRLFGGARPLFWIWVCCESFQLLSNPITVPLPLYNCRVGSAKAFGTPNLEPRVGPSARTSRFIEPLAPLTIKPPIITLLPVWTRPRVDMLDSCDVARTSTSHT